MAANTNALVVKIANGTEIRRFTTKAHECTWKSLSMNIKEFFDIKVFENKLYDAKKNEFKLTYVDDEGDKITLSSETELNEAKSLALHSSPPVLRLTFVASKPSRKLTMADAATGAATAPTADAANQAKPTTADHSTGAGEADETAKLLEHLSKQLPSLLSQLPDGVRKLIPHAELDVAATLAANAAANAPCAAAAQAYASACSQAAAAAAAAAAATSNAGPKDGCAKNHTTPMGVHPGVSCDRTGMSPIVGDRYHLVGHNYDLCQAEYDKLADKEKLLYQRIPPPFVHHMPNHASTTTTAAAAAEAGHPAATGVHPGVECDRSGMNPIAGMRYNMRGHNYDLCQAEYDKLPADEKGLYQAIPPPRRGRWCAGMGMGMGGPPHGGHGSHHAQGPHGGHGPHHGGGHREHGCWPGAMMAKLAARFVRDVTIFDGTQMAPATPFTKIWRLKNTGEVPWPPGTRMLFVGGDQMTTEMSVPLARQTPVLPGEEVDVVVEMVAPAELGRYLGYWRLVGPMGRRKFGQRVWCHVQVVDPTEGGEDLAGLDEAALASAQAEIARKKSDLAATDEADGDDATDLDADDKSTDAPPAAAAPEAAAPPVAVADAAPVTTGNAAPVTTGSAGPSIVPSTLVDDASERASDDGVLVTAADVTDAAPDAASDAAKEAADDGAMTVEKVANELHAMGFTDAALVAIVLDKHGTDLNACARDLAAATEWGPLLDDLDEMGFSNRELNKSLLLKHSGNMKRTVRELVEDA